MKNPVATFSLILLILLLSGFFWSDITWLSVNAEIDQKFPSVVSISTDELKKLLDNGQLPVIFDVREKKEYEISHLPGAQHRDDAREVTLEKSTPIAAYCSVGLRSAQFLEKLQKRGYTNLRNVRGSIFEWANKDYPLMRKMLPVFTVHPYNKKWGKLLKQEKHQYALPDT